MKLHVNQSVVRTLLRLVWLHFISNCQFQLFGAEWLRGSHYPSRRTAGCMIFKELGEGGGATPLQQAASVLAGP